MGNRKALSSIRLACCMVIVLLGIFSSCSKNEKRVLVFSKTSGYRHESIEDGKAAMARLGAENEFRVDTTENAEWFHEDTLKRYHAVIFLSTTKDVLNTAQQSAFRRYIEAGGGFVGIHAAADTEYEWPWFGKLVGAYFKSHPHIQQATLRKVKPFGTNAQPDSWSRTDEWYNYHSVSDKINVLFTLDESTYQGGENGKDHPISWYQEFEGGRSFYTGLGHTKESYTDSLFLQHILDGINYAAGQGEGPDFAKARTKRTPEEDRFSKVVLDFNLFEPTEMAVLPDGRVLFTERRGNVKLYTPSDNKVTIVNTFNVNTTHEDGMIGLTLDPGFARNNYLYIFYSHPQRSSNVLSRFTFADGKVDMTSEKELLEVPVQREQCCHTGGSLAFGPGGNLFISTGDNTSPFESNGFSPSDERPGRAPFDAQKSSSNTNDLRGKILRIHPEPDGTYTIPDGNLFPEGEARTRPEIYVMGCRNPYRIAVDQKTGFLYWGEVGPDAGENDSVRGPRGYDEVNQAKRAGFFGWPYFVGNNYAYARFDFKTSKAATQWDANAPLNQSPNNTGKRELPPAQPAYVWYPYAKSEEFQMVKEGGRNAMAGPVYYSENYEDVKTAFPDYFDGKPLIYDWMRNWMFHITTTSDGAIFDMEPFMPSTRFNNIIDLEYGPDGRLYMLEYGTGWFKQNIDASLVRIDYNPGNRPPVAMLTADRFHGALPLTVSFDAKGSRDPDGDPVSFDLLVTGKTQTSRDGKFSYTFDQPGAHQVKLIVRDKSGATGESSIQIIAGNEPAKVTATITSGNSMFFFPNTTVGYEIRVDDKEDGSTTNGTITGDKVKVTFDFVKGFDMTGVAQGHQAAPIEAPGKSLMEKSDCKSCHLIDQKSAGPSYRDIAKKYKTQTQAVDQLAVKIIKGGSGVWGNIEMSAHPQVSEADAKKMVEYILSLSEEKALPTLPIKGIVKTGSQDDGAYLLSASYQDVVQGKAPSLSAGTTFVLRSPAIKSDQAKELNGPRILRWEGQVSLENIKHNSSAAFDSLDLTSVKVVEVTGFILPDRQVGGSVELRLDRIDGEELGRAEFTRAGLTSTPIKLKAPLTGVHRIYTIFKNPSAPDQDLFFFGGLKLKN